MPKVKKANKRGKNRAHPYADGDGDHPMEAVGQAPAESALLVAAKVAAASAADVPVPGSPPGGPAAATGESHHALRSRQVAEWKAMKGEVAALKRSRKKLPKKGGKDEKKAVSQKIRKLIASLRAKHEAELKAAGLEVPAADDADADAEDMSDE
mmetsp:Transcript_124286/g.264879  ORF Transcript_124286/g.264879 Transcript_124286/m.264879 type:complete len:154 (-) Transcript_124286:105-566(-)